MCQKKSWYKSQPPPPNTQCYRVPTIFPIASTRTSAKFTPYIAIWFLTLPSFLTSSLPREAPEWQPEDRCQNQTTVARTRRPSPEPDDRRQNQTTVARTRRRPFKQPGNEYHKRFNQSIHWIEPELRYRPIAESNQGLLGRHPRRPPFECTASERP